jgi:Tol biopolymer transport system component
LSVATGVSLAAAVAAGLAGAGTSGEAPSVIATVRPDTGAIVELLRGPGGEGPPLSTSWSPDGKTLVYGRLPCDGCAPEIRMLDAGRRASNRLGRLLAHGLVPSLSPSGTTVAYVGIAGGIDTITVGGARKRSVIRPDDPGRPIVDEPRVSPNGKTILFVRSGPSGHRSIVTGPLRTGLVRSLSDPAESFENPAWSPDGRRIAFAEQLATGLWQIGVMHADGSGKEILSDRRHNDSYPAWAPSGAMLAFVRDVGHAHAIYTMRVDGSHVRRITPTRLDALQPSWSPSGETIAFSENTPRS